MKAEYIVFLSKDSFPLQKDAHFLDKDLNVIKVVKNCYAIELEGRGEHAVIKSMHPKEKLLAAKAKLSFEANEQNEIYHLSLEYARHKIQLDRQMYDENGKLKLKEETINMVRGIIGDIFK